MDKQEVLESWGRLMKELDEIKNRDESLILLGDLNRAIRAGEQGEPGNHKHVSYGGQLVRELLADKEYILVNSIQEAEGGPWTWTSRANNKVKSCLDLVIVSADILPYISSLEVDVRMEHKMFRVRKGTDRLKMIPSDHLPLILRLKNMPTRRLKREQNSNWNLNNLEGWKKFQELQSTV